MSKKKKRKKVTAPGAVKSPIQRRMKFRMDDEGAPVTGRPRGVGVTITDELSFE